MSPAVRWTRMVTRLLVTTAGPAVLGCTLLRPLDDLEGGAAGASPVTTESERLDPESPLAADAGDSLEASAPGSDPVPETPEETTLGATCEGDCEALAVDPLAVDPAAIDPAAIEPTGVAQPGCAGDRALLRSDDGWTFCIDRREVTQRQYAAFLEALSLADAPGPLAADATCALELDHAPGNAGDCSGAYAPDVTPAHPVACVDVCDARAYCSWSGGHLCGGRNGELLERGPLGDDLDGSEWYRACAGAEGRAHPYGPNPVDGACNVAGGQSAPVGSFEGCQTPEGVLDLEGNVSEWTHHGAYPRGDEDPDNADVLRFAVRGGSYASTPGASGCPSGGVPELEGDRALPWTSQLPHVGFRCCADPIE